MSLVGHDALLLSLVGHDALLLSLVGHDALLLSLVGHDAMQCSDQNQVKNQYWIEVIITKFCNYFASMSQDLRFKHALTSYVTKVFIPKCCTLNCIFMKLSYHTKTI